MKKNFGWLLAGLILFSGCGLTGVLQESGFQNTDQELDTEALSSGFFRNHQIPVPVGYWSLDRIETLSFTNTNGTFFRDRSTNLAHARITGNVTTAPGKSGMAASFHGGQDQLVIDDRPVFHFTGSMTVSAWVKPQKMRGFATIINKLYAPDSFILGMRDGNYEFSIAQNDGSQWGRTTTIRWPAVENVWAQISATFDGSNLIMYINGEEKARTAVVLTLPIQDSSRPLVIGNHPDWNDFSGSIDEVMLFSQALSGSQLTAIFSETVSGGSFQPDTRCLLQTSADTNDWKAMSAAGTGILFDSITNRAIYRTAVLRIVPGFAGSGHSLKLDDQQNLFLAYSGKVRPSAGAAETGTLSVLASAPALSAAAAQSMTFQMRKPLNSNTAGVSIESLASPGSYLLLDKTSGVYYFKDLDSITADELDKATFVFQNAFADFVSFEAFRDYGLDLGTKTTDKGDKKWDLPTGGFYKITLSDLRKMIMDITGIYLLPVPDWLKNEKIKVPNLHLGINYNKVHYYKPLAVAYDDYDNFRVVIWRGDYNMNGLDNVNALIPSFIKGKDGLYRSGAEIGVYKKRNGKYMPYHDYWFSNKNGFKLEFRLVYKGQTPKGGYQTGEVIVSRAKGETWWASRFLGSKSKVQFPYQETILYFKIDNAHYGHEWQKWEGNNQLGGWGDDDRNSRHYDSYSASLESMRKLMDSSGQDMMTVINKSLEDAILGR